jgi:hypothetical protein
MLNQKNGDFDLAPTLASPLKAGSGGGEAGGGEAGGFEVAVVFSLIKFSRS